MSADNKPNPAGLRLVKGTRRDGRSAGGRSIKPAKGVEQFGRAHADRVQAELARSLALVRTLRAALAVVEDGAWVGDGAKVWPSHWGPLLGLVVQFLERVRDIAIDTAKAPTIHWMEPLSLAEALDAGLWGEARAVPAESDGSARLDAGDVDLVLQVLAEELEVTAALFEVAAHQHLAPQET